MTVPNTAAEVAAVNNTNKKVTLLMLFLLTP